MPCELTAHTHICNDGGLQDVLSVSRQVSTVIKIRPSVAVAKATGAHQIFH